MQETAILEPAAEEIEAAPATSEESASQETAPDDAQSAFMNALLRGELDKVADSTSKPDETDEVDGAEATDGESAPAGDVKPSATTGRRGAAARIAELEAENARLKKAYDEANPPPPDASEEARNAIIARENRYRDLIARPDDDPVVNDGDNYIWLQDEKRRRALFPEMQQHTDTVLAAEIERARADGLAFSRNVKAQMATDYASGAELYGADVEAIKAAATFAERDRIIAAAVAAHYEPEIRRLRQELSESRRDALGAARVPMNGGRSAPGRTYDENTYMNTLLRGGRV